MGQRPETREGHTTDSEDHSMHIESSSHYHDSTTGVGGVHIFIEGEREGEVIRSLIAGPISAVLIAQ